MTAPLGGRQVAALGIGPPGVAATGALSPRPKNLPLLNGSDIAVLATAAGGRRAAIDNVARCFVLAEARSGAARGARDVELGPTLGTGVCSAGASSSGVSWVAGIHTGRRERRGASHCAVSRSRVMSRARAWCALITRAAVKSRDRGRRGCCRAAELGDEAARAAWRSIAADLGFLCERAVLFLDPDCLVLGGLDFSGARRCLSKDLGEAMIRRPAPEITCSRQPRNDGRGHRRRCPQHPPAMNRRQPAARRPDPAGWRREIGRGATKLAGVRRNLDDVRER